MQGSSQACLAKSVYELTGSSFEKLEGVNFPVFEDNKLFYSPAIFDFEPIWVPTEGNN